jgi:cytochrome c peroxidase
MKYYVIILLAGAVIIACSKADISREPKPVVLEVPANFPAASNMIGNPLTLEGIELGRMLFYDKRLSGSNQISCGSCHKPDLSFSDGMAFSNIGESGNALHRNTPALVNMAWINNGLFWDGGSTNLESQALAPLTNPDEMHQELFELVNELKAVPDYVSRFRFVFKDDEIKTGNIMKALAQFQRTFISAGSRYDKYKRKEPGGVLDRVELQGMQLVQSKCAGCHVGELFTDNDYHNNGIDADFSDNSFEGIYKGRYRITYNNADLGKFKTPTLRNVLLTSPYMHDGRFAIIDEVLNHYSNNVKTSITLDPFMLQQNGQPGIPMTYDEKQAIIAFLKSLTDSAFIANPKLLKPN